MATGILYEGDGFLRKGPAYAAKPTAKAGAKAADRKVKVIGDAESVAIEAREKALRRQYLPGWICDLMEN